jgi:hypothetical protein
MDMSARRVLGCVLIGLAALGMSGCAVSRTHTLVADGIYEEARLLAMPGSDGYDPARSLLLFEEFVGRFPSDGRAAEARERVSLLREIVALQDELKRLKEIDLRRRFIRNP